MEARVGSGEVEEKTTRKGDLKTLKLRRGREAILSFPFLKTLQESHGLHEDSQTPEPKHEPSAVCGSSSRPVSDHTGQP